MHVWRQFWTYFTTLLRFMCSCHIFVCLFFSVFVYLSVLIFKAMNIIALNASRQPINRRTNGIDCSTRVNSSSFRYDRHVSLIHSFCTNAIRFIDDFISFMKTKWFLFMQCRAGRDRKKEKKVISSHSSYFCCSHFATVLNAMLKSLNSTFFFVCFKHSFQFQWADFLHYSQP